VLLFFNSWPVPDRYLSASASQDTRIFVLGGSYIDGAGSELRLCALVAFFFCFCVCVLICVRLFGFHVFQVLPQ
jgi:hypothetical protein